MNKPPTDRVIDEVINRIIQRRADLGLSHEKLAEKAGIHRTTIGAIERKAQMPSLLNCYRLCRALDMSLGDLIKQAEKSVR